MTLLELSKWLSETTTEQEKNTKVSEMKKEEPEAGGEEICGKLTKEEEALEAALHLARDMTDQEKRRKYKARLRKFNEDLIEETKPIIYEAIYTYMTYGKEDRKVKDFYESLGKALHNLATSPAQRKKGRSDNLQPFVVLLIEKLKNFIIIEDEPVKTRGL